MFKFIQKPSQSRLNLPDKLKSRTNSKAAIGYFLLSISIIASVSTFIDSEFKNSVDAYEVTTNINSNQLIRSHQVKLVKISTSDAKLASEFATMTEISHKLTRNSLSKGQLVQISDLGNIAPISKPEAEMTLALKPSQAPLSQLSPGTYLRIISTTGSGQSAASRVVANAVEVLKINDSPAGSLASSQGSAYVLVELRNPVEQLAIAQAENTGNITAVVVSGPNTPSFNGVYSLDILKIPSISH